jgi:hypothetical protein
MPAAWCAIAGSDGIRSSTPNQGQHLNALHEPAWDMFRGRLVEPRRTALRQVLAEGISRGQLPGSADPDILASMLIGSFYARNIAGSDIRQLGRRGPAARMARSSQPCFWAHSR